MTVGIYKYISFIFKTKQKSQKKMVELNICKIHELNSSREKLMKKIY